MPSEKLEPAISQRISFLRSVMIIGIVWLHVPPIVPIDQLDGSPFSLLKGFIAEILFRCAVPVLTAISGFFLFRGELDRRFRSALRQKSRTLLIPFLLWNVPCATLLYLCQRSGYFATDSFASLHPFEPRVWLDGFFAATNVPVNYPLHFLRDSFALVLIAPALGVLLRRVPRAGLVVIATLFLLDLDGYVILRNDMAVSFYLGGWVAVSRADLRGLDRFCLPLGLAFLGLCGFLLFFPEYPVSWLQPIAPIFIWPAVSAAAATRAGHALARLARHSFIVFLVHAPVLALLWRLQQSLTPAPLPYPVFWIAAPLLAAATAIALHAALARHASGLGSWLLGGRLTPAPPPALVPRPAYRAEPRSAPLR